MAEQLDIYDANKKMIGTADRNVAHTFGLWHKTIHCWIGVQNQSDKRQIVFQRRDYSSGTANDGKLYTTASGHVSAGETLNDAFAREISQEVGIAVENPIFMSETTWVADMPRKDGSVMVDRVFANVYYKILVGDTLDLTFWRKFLFNDGEVCGLVAVDTDEFIRLCDGSQDKISGTEWNGKELSKITLSPGDFVVNSGETLSGKYKSIAEIIGKGKI